MMEEGTYSKGTGCITRHCPSPSSVEGRAFFHEDTNDTTSSEGLRVHLTLDLQRIERQEHLGFSARTKVQKSQHSFLNNLISTSRKRKGKTHHFSNTRQTSRRCLHHHLPLPLPKRIRETSLVPRGDEVIKVRLPAKLVYPLGDFVSSSVSKTRKERDEATPKRCACVLPEENL